MKSPAPLRQGRDGGVWFLMPLLTSAGAAPPGPRPLLQDQLGLTSCSALLSPTSAQDSFSRKRDAREEPGFRPGAAQKVEAEGKHRSALVGTGSRESWCLRSPGLSDTPDSSILTRDSLRKAGVWPWPGCLLVLGFGVWTLKFPHLKFLFPNSLCQAQHHVLYEGLKN